MEEKFHVHLFLKAAKQFFCRIKLFTNDRVNRHAHV